MKIKVKTIDGATYESATLGNSSEVLHKLKNTKIEHMGAFCIPLDTKTEVCFNVNHIVAITITQ